MLHTHTHTYIHHKHSPFNKPLGHKMPISIEKPERPPTIYLVKYNWPRNTRGDTILLKRGFYQRKILNIGYWEAERKKDIYIYVRERLAI